jgi:hypothetical protein
MSAKKIKAPQFFIGNQTDYICAVLDKFDQLGTLLVFVVFGPGCVNELNRLYSSIKLKLEKGDLTGYLDRMEGQYIISVDLSGFGIMP